MPFEWLPRWLRPSCLCTRDLRLILCLFLFLNGCFTSLSLSGARQGDDGRRFGACQERRFGQHQGRGVKSTTRARLRLLRLVGFLRIDSVCLALATVVWHPALAADTMRINKASFIQLIFFLTARFGRLDVSNSHTPIFESSLENVQGETSAGRPL